MINLGRLSRKQEIVKSIMARHLQQKDQNGNSNYPSSGINSNKSCRVYPSMDNTLDILNLKKIELFTMAKFLFLFLLTTCSLTKVYSQEEESIVTNLLWFEDKGDFYSTSNADFLIPNSFVAYDPLTDSVTNNNYFLGYYVFRALTEDNGKKVSAFATINEIVQNITLVSDYEFGGDNKIPLTQLEFNEYWKYTLFKVTYQYIYIGEIESPIPILNDSNKSKRLEYERKRIPYYFIKIKSLEPYYKRLNQSPLPTCK